MPNTTTPAETDVSALAAQIVTIYGDKLVASDVHAVADDGFSAGYTQCYALIVSEPAEDPRQARYGIVDAVLHSDGTLSRTGIGTYCFTADQAVATYAARIGRAVTVDFGDDLVIACDPT